MIIHLKKFGVMLISRPTGRECWLVAQAYILPKSTDEQMVVDFEGVAVISPSWADEFLSKLVERQGKRNIVFQNTDNPSVRATLQTLELME